MYRFKTVGELRAERYTLRKDWIYLYGRLFAGSPISDQLAEDILAPKYKHRPAYSQVNIDFYTIEDHMRRKHTLVIDPEDITEKEYPGTLRKRLFPVKKANIRREESGHYTCLDDPFHFKV